MALSSSVLLDRKYFKELLRRADCSAANDSGASRAFEHAVLIPSDEYEALQLVTRRFVTLCDNLRSGGVDEDTLKTLWGGDEESYDEPQPAPPVRARTTSVQKKPDAASQTQTQAQVQTQTRSYDAGSTRTSVTAGSNNGVMSDDGRDDASAGAYDFVDSNIVDQTGTPPSEPEPERKTLRTIQLMSLPESATLADVAAAVRGGPLLELYIRAHDRSAFVSFVRGADAREFWEHVRKHDLYIKSRRIDIRWSERQFTMMPYVGVQVNAGASRNMVIYQCDPRITEAMIRKDLEHIHNLDIISITFASGNCYIKANSIHNAMYARSCLMSRVAYRGSKIDWDADECAEPLPQIKTVKRTKKKPTAKKPPTFAAPNRFQMLKIVDDDNTADVPADGVDGGIAVEVP